MIPFVATGAGLRASLQEGFLECQHPHQLMTKLGKLFFEIWPEEEQYSLYWLQLVTIDTGTNDELTNVYTIVHILSLVC